VEFFMHIHEMAAPCWSTSSFGAAVDTLPMELSALGAHLASCNLSRGRLFALRCVADAMNGFVAGRFVTTLVVMALLIGAGSLVF
jgi:hypothetical protein